MIVTHIIDNGGPVCGHQPRDSTDALWLLPIDGVLERLDQGHPVCAVCLAIDRPTLQLHRP